MLHSDPAAAISRAAIDGKCGLSEQAIDLFRVDLRSGSRKPGTENHGYRRYLSGRRYCAQDVAQASRASVYGSFLSKGRMQHLLEAIPLK